MHVRGKVDILDGWRWVMALGGLEAIGVRFEFALGGFVGKSVHLFNTY